jgi:hypothetical protein
MDQAVNGPTLVFRGSGRICFVGFFFAKARIRVAGDIVA